MVNENVAATVLRRLRLLIWATVALGVALLVVAGFAIGYAVNATDQADNAKAALCASRTDYQNRVRQTEQFERKHPHGALGYTPAQIEVQRRLQQRTVDSLDVLHCP